MAGLDPAIDYPHQIANDAIPVSNHPRENGQVEPSDDVVGPLEIAGSSPAMTGLGACAQYFNSKGPWYNTNRR